jgi:hypothetical protein
MSCVFSEVDAETGLALGGGQVATLLELMLVVNSTVLVLSMNVAAIVIQIASTRFSSQVSTIFFQRCVEWRFFMLGRG